MKVNCCPCLVVLALLGTAPAVAEAAGDRGDPNGRVSQPAENRCGEAEKEVKPQAVREQEAGAEVELTREGRLLTMSYQAFDANGRNRINPDDAPPRFTICHNGREIGSGSFEYG